MKLNIRKLVVAAMLAALCCVATAVIKIPAPYAGYIHPGDGFVLLAGWVLSPLYAFLSAGIGSLLADIFAGYAVYAPVTFVIKGLMAVIACFAFKWLHGKTGHFGSRLIGGVTAEIVMLAGYWVFEGCLYGFLPALANIPAGAVQAGAGLLIGLLLAKILENKKLF